MLLFFSIIISASKTQPTILFQTLNKLFTVAKFKRHLKLVKTSEKQPDKIFDIIDCNAPPSVCVLADCLWVGDAPDFVQIINKKIWYKKNIVYVKQARTTECQTKSVFPKWCKQASSFLQ